MTCAGGAPEASIGGDRGPGALVLDDASVGRRQHWGACRVFRGYPNSTPNFRFLFFDNFRVAILKTRNFKNPNYPTRNFRVTQMPTHRTSQLLYPLVVW
jgi:hypothetical protein